MDLLIIYKNRNISEYDVTRTITISWDIAVKNMFRYNESNFVHGNELILRRYAEATRKLRYEQGICGQDISVIVESQDREIYRS